MIIIPNSQVNFVKCISVHYFTEIKLCTNGNLQFLHVYIKNIFLTSIQNTAVFTKKLQVIKI